MSALATPQEQLGEFRVSADALRQARDTYDSIAIYETKSASAPDGTITGLLRGHVLTVSDAQAWLDGADPHTLPTLTHVVGAHVDLDEDGYTMSPCRVGATWQVTQQFLDAPDLSKWRAFCEESLASCVAAYGWHLTSGTLTEVAQGSTDWLSRRHSVRVSAWVAPDGADSRPLPGPPPLVEYGDEE